MLAPFTTYRERMFDLSGTRHAVTSVPAVVCVNRVSSSVFHDVQYNQCALSLHFAIAGEFARGRFAAASA